MSDLCSDSSAAVASIHRRAASNGSFDGELPCSLELELVVDDPSVIRALVAYADDDARNEFALEALRIGVAALRHVSGQVSADLIQREVRGMQRTLEQHNQVVHMQLSATLKEYFDPKDGRLSHRLHGLVAQDGELAQLIKGYIDGENSLLARTLITHVGLDSPLMKNLDPDQAKGFLGILKQMVDGQLATHGKVVLDEFSLDKKDGALSRFIGELTTKHGNLTEALQTRVEALAKELSLNEPNSALSRLVQNVTQSQRTITNEFSLDSDTSCLSRFKRELMTILEAQVKTNAEFQEEVKGSLRELTVRREEIARSTRHGMIFQDAVCELLTREAQNAGDIAIPVGNTTGLVKQCKVGDCVIELGPDSAAAGAKIVIEAKEEEKYTLQRAIAEIDEARKNRDAEWGVFVFSQKTAPAGLDPFRRYGRDFFVIWDAENPVTDVYLKIAIDAARALCFGIQRQCAAQQVDFDVIDKAILEIERRAGNLEEVRKSAETIQSSSAKILDRVRIDRESLEKQVALLREKTADLKQLVNAPRQ